MQPAILNSIGSAIQGLGDGPSADVQSLFNQAHQAHFQALRPTPDPQMPHPSPLLFGIAALLNAMDRRNQPGGALLGGFNQGAQFKYQQDTQHQKDEQQRNLGLGDLYHQEATDKYEQQKFGVQQRDKREDSIRDSNDRQLGYRLAYDRTLDKDTADNATKLAIAQERERTNRERITGSLARAKSATEAKWIAVFGNAQQTPEMKAAAFASLQKLNPETYGDMDPTELQDAIQKSPAIQRLTESRILTENKKRQNFDSIITRRAQQNKLDANRTALLGKEVEHYDETLREKAADIHSRILYRQQSLDQGAQRIGIAQQNAWNTQTNRDQTAVRANRNTELGTQKALAGLEQENIKAILKRHGGSPPAEDDEDYGNYAVSQQKLNDARLKLRELGRAAGPASIEVPFPSGGNPNAPYTPNLGQSAPPAKRTMGGDPKALRMEKDRTDGLKLIKSRPDKAGLIRKRFQQTYGVPLG